jgi:broad specificity phosphatase PhoE
MPQTIFLIRHGQSTHNEVWEATGTDPLHFDAPLSELGKRQVEAAQSAARGLEVELVVTSPLTRAIQTAVGLFGNEVPLLITPIHRERLANGCDVGRPPAMLTADFPTLKFDHLEDCWWYDSTERDARGFAIEPLEALAERVQSFQAWLPSLPQRKVAIVGHGAFFRHMTGTMFDNCAIMEWRPADGARAASLRRHEP